MYDREKTALKRMQKNGMKLKSHKGSKFYRSSCSRISDYLIEDLIDHDICFQKLAKRD